MEIAALAASILPVPLIENDMTQLIYADEQMRPLNSVTGENRNLSNSGVSRNQYVLLSLPTFASLDINHTNTIFRVSIFFVASL